MTTTGPDPLLTCLLAEGCVDAAQAAAIAAHRARAGGTLDTCAMELGLLDEEQALLGIARAFAVHTADRSRIDEATPAARGALPRSIAEAHRLVPLTLSGRKLTVACSIPDDIAAFDAVLDDVGFACSLYLRPVWTTEALAAWGLHRAFGTPLPERLRVLFEHPHGRGAGTASSAAVPRSPVVDGSRDGRGDGGSDGRGDVGGDSDGDGRTGDATLGASARVTSSPRSAVIDDFFVVDLRTSNAAPRATSSTSSTSPTTPMPTARGTPDDHSGWRVATRGLPPAPVGAGPAMTTSRIALVVEATVTGPHAAAIDARAHDAHADSAARTRAARRRARVSWSLEDAAAEIVLCTQRDEIIEVALRFARRDLRAAAFVVRHGSAFVIHDVIDDEHASDALRTCTLPADGDHVVARAISLGSPLLGPVTDDDPLCRALGRTPRAVCVVPVAVAGRVVAAIVGDNGPHAVPTSTLAELHLVAPRVGAALTALLVRSKRDASSTPPAPAPSPPARGPDAVDELFFEIDVQLQPEADAPVAGDTTMVDGASTTDPTRVPVEPRPAGSTAADVPVATAGPVTAAALPVDATAAAPAAAAPIAAPPVEPTVAPAPAAVAAATPAAETIDDDEPPLPGAHAKESLLLATWRRWLRAERDAFDDDVALLADHGLPAQDGNDDRTTDSAAGVDPRVDDAVARLVRGGRRALPALARGFPGRLPWPPLHGRARSLRGAPAPAPASVLGVLATLGADASAAILTGALDAADADTRAAAVMALHAIDVPAAVARLGGRVFDREARIARLAVEVLDVRRASPLFPAVAERLRDLCRRGDDDERERAIAAVAALRDIDAIGVLVQLLHVRPTTIAEAAHDALVQITRADFGFAERRWIAWHADHGHEPRTRWLLRALANVDANLRRGAADDLALLGIDVHAFRFDAPPTERAAALAGIAYALGEPSP